MPKSINIKRIRGLKRRHLAKRFAKWGFTKGVEIGTCHGTFAAVLCENNPKLELKTVDPFIAVYQDYRSLKIGNKGQERLYKQAKEKLKPYNCEIVRKHSLEAVLDYPYESIDFVYIDGSHEFDYVMTDIIVWGMRVKKGGVISGHDYVDFLRRADVKGAVNTYAKAHDVGTIYITDERSPSWWFKRTW